MKDIPERLEERRAQASLGGGGKNRVLAQHTRGKMTAHARIEPLLGHGSFGRFDLFVQHSANDVGAGKRKIAGRGVITGTPSRIRRTRVRSASRTPTP